MSSTGKSSAAPLLAAIGVIVVLGFGYYLTAPSVRFGASGRDTGAAPGEVLQVGALPVT